MPTIIYEKIPGVQLRRDQYQTFPIAFNSNKKNTLQQLDLFLAGTQELHKAGFVHGDIKPQNIWVVYKNPVAQGLERLVLGDFDTIKRTGEQRHPNATAGYFPPEFLSQNNTLTSTSDIFQLGKTLFRIFGNCFDTGFTWLSDPNEDISDNPEFQKQFIDAFGNQVFTILRKCIEQNPQERYQTVEELRQELIPALAEAWGVELPESSSPLPPPA